MYMLGIDIGTSCAKCLAITRDGRVAARVSQEYPLLTPRPGWAEQDPAWWVKAAFDSIRRIWDVSGIRPEEIDGISFSGQMHGLVPLGRKGQVLRKSILWCDQRTAPQCREIEEKAGGRNALLEMTNNVMLPGYTGGKILWLLQEEPECFRKMTVFLCPKDYLRYCLTGEICMDVSEASGTGLFDTRNRRWCTRLTESLGLSPSLFPPVLESTAPAGKVTKEAAARTGLLEGTPCYAGGGDAVVQSFGSGLIREGRVGVVIGTAGNVSMGFTRYTPNPEGKLQAFCGVTPGSYMSFGATQTAGGALRWFRDELCGNVLARAEAEDADAFDLMSAMAEKKQAPEITCPRCGETYAEFQKTGMLGCAECYTAFRKELTPLITRVQGRAQHAGRRPPVSEEEQARQTRMEELRTLMEAAVAEENFEEAARLRDELRAMTPAKEAQA